MVLLIYPKFWLGLVLDKLSLFIPSLRVKRYILLLYCAWSTSTTALPHFEYFVSSIRIIWSMLYLLVFRHTRGRVYDTCIQTFIIPVTPPLEIPIRHAHVDTYLYHVYVYDISSDSRDILLRMQYANTCSYRHCIAHISYPPVHPTVATMYIATSTIRAQLFKFSFFFPTTLHTCRDPIGHAATGQSRLQYLQYLHT